MLRFEGFFFLRTGHVATHTDVQQMVTVTHVSIQSIRNFLKIGKTKTIHLKMLGPNPHQKLNGTSPTDPQVSCNRANRYSGLGVRSAGPTVGDFLEPPQKKTTIKRKSLRNSETQPR